MLTIVRDLKRVPQDSLYMFVGNCRFFKDRALRAIAQKCKIPLSAVYHLDHPAEVKSRVGTRSFMERKRVFLWGGFEKGAEINVEWLKEVRSWIPEGHVLVLDTADRKNTVPERVLEPLGDAVSVFHCDTPRESRGEVSEWIQFNLQGKAIPDAALQELAQNYNSDLYLLDAELEKLRRYPGDLDLETVRNLVTRTARSDLYGWLDLIALRNTEGALRTLSLLLGNTSMGDILAALTRFLSQMMAVGFLVQKGKDTSNMADSLGLSQAQVQRLRAACPRFSTQSLVHTLNHLAQIDLASRREGDPESLLHRTVYLLCSNPDAMVTKYRRGLR